MKYTHAIVRKPGRNFDQGLTSWTGEPPCYEEMTKQHKAYVDALQSLGLEVIVLESLSRFPDGYFVEDTAVLTPTIAVITNPGAESRKGEEDTIASVLSEFRETVRITPPGTLDGGDVLMVENHFFIGLSQRTNRQGAEQLGRILLEKGQPSEVVPVESGLHLKSGISHVGQETLLLTRPFARLPQFRAYRHIVLDDEETYAANTLLVNGHLVMPTGFPETRKKLESLGYPILELDVSESRKMDGGLSCLSIRF